MLDLNLPHVDGLTACREIRRFSSVPILVLSVRDAEQDKVAALDLGADDYLTKPFGAAELLARVRALLRRAAPEPSGTRFELDDLSGSTSARDPCGAATTQVHLTPTEWRLLEALATAPGVLRTHDWLLGRGVGRRRRPRRRGAPGVREPAPRARSSPTRGTRGRS